MSIKSERISLRLDAATKRKIEQAAAITQSSINSLILTTILAKTDQIIRQHNEITLSNTDRDIFFDALLNPPSTNSALNKILDDHSNLVESDV